MKWGLIDFAAGVRKDLPEVERALSYHIQALRRCHKREKLQTCYNGMDIDDLWKKWVEVERCTVEENFEARQLEIDDFLYLFIAVGGVGTVVALIEIYRLWSIGLFDGCIQRRLGHRSSAAFVEKVQAVCEEAWPKDGGFKVQKFMDEWHREKSLREDIAPFVRRHYMKTCVESLIAFDQTVKDLKVEQAYMEKEEVSMKPGADKTHVIEMAKKRIEAALLPQGLLTKRAITEAVASYNDAAVKGNKSTQIHMSDAKFRMSKMNMKKNDEHNS